MSFSATVSKFRDSASTGVVRGVRCVYGRIETIAAIARAGVDYIYLDQQHGLVSTEAIAVAVAAVDRYGVALLIRVPDQSPASIGKALDAGAHGVIVPDVEDAEQGRRAVGATQYPPNGTRSWGTFSLDVDGYSLNPGQAGRPLCFPMIESPRGVTNAPAIASLDGVDGVYVGRFDLALTMGTVLGDFGAPGSHSDATQMIRRACDDAEVLMGTTGKPTELLAQGYRMQTVGSELDLLSVGLTASLGRQHSAHD